jgi:hypothetical protein
MMERRRCDGPAGPHARNGRWTNPCGEDLKPRKTRKTPFYRPVLAVKDLFHELMQPLLQRYFLTAAPTRSRSFIQAAVAELWYVTAGPKPNRSESDYEPHASYNRGMFSTLKCKPRILYRGWSTTHKRALVEQFGVGPMRDVAKKLVDFSGTITPELEAAAAWLFEVLRKSFAGKSGGGFTISGITADMAAIDKLSCVLPVAPKVATTHLSCYEHIVDTTEMGSLPSGRTTESTSLDPCVGILYAYGADLDAWSGRQAIEFTGHTPNRDAFVAIIATDGQHKPTEILEANVDPEILNEVKRRANRDKEVLLWDVQKAVAVALPVFDIAKPLDSVNAAAVILRKAGVAI